MVGIYIFLRCFTIEKKNHKFDKNRQYHKFDHDAFATDKQNQ